MLLFSLLLLFSCNNEKESSKRSVASYTESEQDAFYSSLQSALFEEITNLNWSKKTNQISSIYRNGNAKLKCYRFKSIDQDGNGEDIDEVKAYFEFYENFPLTVEALDGENPSPFIVNGYTYVSQKTNESVFSVDRLSMNLKNTETGEETNLYHDFLIRKDDKTGVEVCLIKDNTFNGKKYGDIEKIWPGESDENLLSLSYSLFSVAKSELEKGIENNIAFNKEGDDLYSCFLTGESGESFYFAYYNEEKNNPVSWILFKEKAGTSYIYHTLVYELDMENEIIRTLIDGSEFSNKK